MKRKIILICVLLIISLVVIGKYKNIKHEKTIHNIKESNIAIMVYDDESDSYIKQSSIPKGAKYSLNEELTKCEVGGTVTNYSKANGTLSYKLNEADQCYVYFDVDNTPSYAIYSKTDNSLIFYKNNDTVGEEYNGRIVTAKYDNIEDSVYTFDSVNKVPNTPWYEYASVIKTVSVANEIMPISTAMWFKGLEYLESINLTNLDTSNVTTMERMFDGAGATSVNFMLDLGPNFYTSNVTTMRTMFQRTGNASTNFVLNLGSKFDTSNVTDMAFMFAGTGKSSTKFMLDLGSKFNTNQVLNMRAMFQTLGYSNEKFTFNLGDKFDTSKVTDMTNMFWSMGYTSTEFTLDLGNMFNTSQVTTMQTMFENAGYRNEVFYLDLGDKFDTYNVIDMRGLFSQTGHNNQNFELDLSNFVVQPTCVLTALAKYSASKIIFGEGWSNASLVSGMFKYDSSTPIEIVNAPANIQSYDFAADNRVVTFTTI